MQICLVNLVDLDPPLNGGAWRVAQAVCRMLADHPGAVFVVKWAFAAQFHEWLGRTDAKVIPYIATDETLPPLLRAIQPDCIVSPLFGMQPFDRFFPDVPHVVAIPDALALDKLDVFTPVQRAGRQRIYDALPQARLIVTVSDYARGRLLHHLPLDEKQVTYIYHGAEGGGAAPADFMPRPYVYYPANLWPHKRHDLLLRTMKIIWQTRSEVKLVLTGGGRGESGIAPLLEKHSIPPENVIDLGYVDDEVIPALYQNAEALLFTSEHEGFGMPLVEAMQNGCPVICAPLTAIPEVAGDAALYVDSDDPAAWARVFLDELPAQREMLIAGGRERAAIFTWAQAQAEWRKALAGVGLDFGTSGEEMGVPLATVAAELSEWHRRIIEKRLPSAGITRMTHLQELYEQIDSLRKQEREHRMAQLPVIGLPARLILRLVNLGRMWNLQTQLYRAIIEELENR